MAKDAAATHPLGRDRDEASMVERCGVGVVGRAGCAAELAGA
jgi:hypothetical protein